MSGTTLTTIIIVLSEIVVVLLAMGGFLYLRSRKQKSTHANLTSPAIIPQAATNEKNEPSPLAYIEAEISRTSSRLEDSDAAHDPVEQSRLKARLNLLRAERQVLDDLTDKNENTDYWAIIRRCYENEDENKDEVENTIAEDSIDKRDAIYLARIKNLENFKAMFLDSEERLKDSFDTINELKNALTNLSQTEETAQLEAMVDKLSIDNINSNKQLNDANQQLQSVLEELNVLRDADNMPAPAEMAESETQEPSTLDYIETEIHRTATQLQEIDNAAGPSAQASLDTRLKLLHAEKQLLESLPGDGAESDYWLAIDKCYSNDADVNNAQDRADARDAIYLARIKNLENFKSMFSDSQDQLKDSFNTINNLKNALGNISSAEEAAQLDDMLDKLSIDNINLNKQLHDAHQQLHSMLDELDALREKLESTDLSLEQLNTEMIDDLSEQNMNLAKQLNDATQQIETLQESTSRLMQEASETQANSPDTDAMNQQIETLKEENEFLTTQIEHLLQQEAESSDLMKAQMQRLETALKEKEAEAAVQATATSVDGDGVDQSAKLLIIEEENRFLATQIEYLLQQEVENTRQMKEQIEQLKTTLKEKETECEALAQTGTARDGKDGELTSKLQSVEEENQFLCDQIQHLLQQELESSKCMKTQMEQLETALKEKQTECDKLRDTVSD
jgi:hypothetical protein